MSGVSRLTVKAVMSSHARDRERDVSFMVWLHEEGSCIWIVVALYHGDGDEGALGLMIT